MKASGQLRTATSEGIWADQVRQGSLEAAHRIFQRAGHRIVHRIASLMPQQIVRLLSLCFFLLSKRYPTDRSHTAVDLSDSFLLFWRKADLVGPVLCLAIARHLLVQRTLPLRATAWFAHWLVIQGEYRIGVRLLKRVRSESRSEPQIAIEVNTFIGNYWFSRGFQSRAERTFESNDSLSSSLGNDFIRTFNLSLWVMNAASLREMNSLNSILARFDSLSPDRPDERFGLRVLSVAAYLNLKFGNVEIGNQFWHSATQVYLKSGSPLDRGLYLIFKGLVEILAGDQSEAIMSLQAARRSIAAFGRYAFYEQLIDCLVLKFQGAHLDAAAIRERFPDHCGLWPLLAQAESNSERRPITALQVGSWYRGYFETILPLIESLDKFEMQELVSLVKEQTQASDVKCDVTDPVGQISHINFVGLENGSSQFKFNFIHRGKVCTMSFTTPFQPWRNRDLFVAIKSMVASMQAISFQSHFLREESKQRTIIETNNLARQVAHDIRSPLMALGILLKGRARFDLESERDLATAATDRINSIANELLRRSREASGKSLAKSFESKELVVDVLQSVVNEKQLLNSHRGGLLFSFLPNTTLGVLPAKVCKADFQRVVSNLIDNSVEAIPADGIIRIHYELTTKNINICIEDTGIGMTQEVINSILHEGGTFNKPLGNGLGLRHANHFLKSIGAHLNVDSTLGKGTKILITLPC